MVFIAGREHAFILLLRHAEKMEREEEEEVVDYGQLALSCLLFTTHNTIATPLLPAPGHSNAHIESLRNLHGIVYWKSIMCCSSEAITLLKLCVRIIELLRNRRRYNTNASSR